MSTPKWIDRLARRLADWRIVAAAGVTWAGLAAVLFAWSGRFSVSAVAAACGVSAPDVAFAPSVSSTEAFLAACGQRGLVAYRDLQVVDLLYPAVTAVFLGAVLALLLRRMRPSAAWLALVPAGAAVGDYAENAAAWVLITVGPANASWASSILQVGSAVKVVLSWASWLLILALLAAIAARAAARRFGYAAPPALRRL